MESSCKEGNIVGSDEELCDGSLDEKLEDCRVGCIEEYSVEQQMDRK